VKLSAKQIKAARAMLDWSRAELAAACGVSEPNIIRLEAGGDGRQDTIQKISTAFENHGIVFTINGGVEPARPELRTYTGMAGMQSFMDDVYQVIKDQGGEVVISGAVEKVFAEAMNDDFLAVHMARMEKLKNYNMRCLIEEGNQDFTANNYCEYRWTSRDQFRPVTFYAYGNKIAFIQFDVPVDAPMIVVLQSKVITDAFRVQFEGMWRTAKVPAKAQAHA
jgi:transcriptional regulator with XRE-family HTH domain